jgi:hypothetical protein
VCAAQGALGNVVRNSPLLCTVRGGGSGGRRALSAGSARAHTQGACPALPCCVAAERGCAVCTVQELIRAGALEALLSLVCDAPPAGGAGGGEGQNPLKIALFSLGNLCSHSACRAHLAALGLRAAVAPLAGSADGATAKYAVRVLAKLGPASSAAAQQER